MLAGVLKYLPDADRETLVVEAMSNEALTTSEIEGEILDRASVQSSIRRHMGLAVDKRKVRPAEEGIAEMMIDLYRAYEAPLTEEGIFAWHGMVMKGRRNLKDVGRYRRGEEPMQVVSGSLDSPKVQSRRHPRERFRKKWRASSNGSIALAGEGQRRCRR
jgi:Fic family protein